MTVLQNKSRSEKAAVQLGSVPMRRIKALFRRRRCWNGGATDPKFGGLNHIVGFSGLTGFRHFLCVLRCHGLWLVLGTRDPLAVGDSSTKSWRKRAIKNVSHSAEQHLWLRAKPYSLGVFVQMVQTVVVQYKIVQYYLIV